MEARPEVDDVDALGGDALGEGGGELDARRAHVVGDEDRGWRRVVVGDEAGERGADRARRWSASSWSGTVPRMS